MAHLNRRQVRQRIHRRIRKKISGTAERPRLAVNFSNKNIYAQVIDDESGRTITSASTLESGVTSTAANIDAARSLGELIATRAKDSKVEEIVFDRGGFLYHGKVKEFADAVRNGGLKF